MVVEILRFITPPELRDEFIERDAEIWTPALAAHPGFVDKEVWADRQDPGRVTIMIHWASCEQWKQFPRDLEEQLDARMRRLYTSFSSEEYEVRKL